MWQLLATVVLRIELNQKVEPNFLETTLFPSATII